MGCAVLDVKHYVVRQSCEITPHDSVNAVDAEA